MLVLRRSRLVTTRPRTGQQRFRKSLALGGLASLAVLPLTAGAAGTAHAEAATSYPYTLVDLGTFGGPSNFLDLPAIPLTSQGVVLGAADTTTADADYPNCPFAGYCDGYNQHAFAWQAGRVTDLGALPGKQNSSAIYELNSHGVGVGYSENGSHDPTGTTAGVAVLFTHGRVISLGTLGGAESFAQDINDQGQVAGNSSNKTPDPFPNPNAFFPWGTETRGFVWRNRVMHDLGTLGGADTLEYAQNDLGQITGVSYTNSTVDPGTGYPTVDPYLWQNGHMTDLGTLGGHFGFANWLNDQGEVVGWSDLAGDQNAQPFLWKNGHMIGLPTIGGGFGFASWISPAGDIAGGYLALPDQQSFHGFLWKDGKMTDLPPVGGAPDAFGNAVNDLGQVVGNENTADNQEVIAVLWSGGLGYDLNTLVAPNPMQMISADYITNQSDIVGHGVLPNGDQRMFLLIRNPSVPLPSAPAPLRPLPAITGPPDHRLSVIHALQAVRRRGIAAAPTGRG
jgi:probable HAF family extracellular repeat protein